MFFNNVHRYLFTIFTALSASTAAYASGPRPFFQLPFRCGQVWEASTYSSHWPDQDSIDLGEWTNSDANMSEGEPVLASADGTVLDVFTAAEVTSPPHGNAVYLDHGDGWVTHYLHLQQAPNLTIGQHLAQGEQIGRVGNTGTEEFHLHYTQLADGQAVRAAFNGSLIDTYTGNLSPWGNGEKLTSANCPMDSFVQWSDNGHRYQLSYKPGNGAVAIDQIEDNGVGSATIWSATWTKGWTHFSQFSQNTQDYYIRYKSSTGEVRFDRADNGGSGVTTIGSGTWSTGWTNIMPFEIGGTNYYFAYKTTNGAVNLDQINASGNGSSTLWSGNWGKGWTHLMPFDLDGEQYFLAYQGGTGAVEIDHISAGLAITEVWSSTWSTGWSHFVPIGHNGDRHILRYKSTTGAVSFGKVNTGGLGITVLGNDTWTRSWTSFSPFSIGSVGHYIRYKTLTGAVGIDHLNASGSAMTTIWNDTWTGGWQ